MAETFGTSQQPPMPITHSQDSTSGFHGSGQMNGHPLSLMGSVSNIDPLTNHLAKMSKHQLYEIMSQMKGIIQQNQQEARLILIANPQLTKALFQAQIMLEMVRPPEPVQMQAIQQIQSQASQPPLVGPVRQTSAMIPQSTNAVVASSTSNVVLQPPVAVYPQAQVNVQPQQTPSYVSVQPSLHQPPRPPVPVAAPGLSTGSTPPPLPPFPPPIQGQPQVTTPSVNFHPSPPMQQTPHQPVMQQQGGVPSLNMGMVYQQAGQPPLPPQPPQPPPQQTYQTGASLKVPDVLRGDSERGPTPVPILAQSGSHRVGGASNTIGQVPGGPSGQGPNYPGGQSAFGSNQGSPFPPASGYMGSITGQPPGVGSVIRLGTGAPNAPMASAPRVGGQNFVPISGTGGGLMGSAVGGTSGPGFVHPQMYGHVRMQAPPQPQQIPVELEQQKALLQQVMNLTPEQINSLPPEQRQQVIQLQQALR